MEKKREKTERTRTLERDMARSQTATTLCTALQRAYTEVRRALAPAATRSRWPWTVRVFIIIIFLIFYYYFCFSFLVRFSTRAFLFLFFFFATTGGGGSMRARLASPRRRRRTPARACEIRARRIRSSSSRAGRRSRGETVRIRYSDGTWLPRRPNRASHTQRAAPTADGGRLTRIRDRPTWRPAGPSRMRPRAADRSVCAPVFGYRRPRRRCRRTGTDGLPRRILPRPD